VFTYVFDQLLATDDIAFLLVIKSFRNYYQNIFFFNRVTTNLGVNKNGLFILR